MFKMELNSIWNITSKPRKSFPALTKTISTEIAIVGGGISGVTAAYLLGKAGRKVVLLEADRIGQGTTGRSTGNLYALVDEHLYKLKSIWGKDVAKDVLSSRAKAIDLIEEIARENKIDCQFERVSFNYFAEKSTEETNAFFDREARAAEELGLRPISHKALGFPFSIDRILEIQNQAQFHPLGYVTALADMLPRTIEVFENSAVIEIDEKKRILRCENGRIAAEKIIFATHVPKGFASVQLRLSPIREHGIAAPLKGQGFQGIFWSVDQPKRSVRTLSVGGQNFVMAIGDKFKTGHHPDPSKENEILKKYLGDRFDVHEPYSWWAAQSYRSADGLPFIGELAEGCYFLTGFSADGLVYGTLGAAVITDDILGRTNRWADLYKAKRLTPVKSAKTVIKEAVENLCEYAKDLPKVGTVPVEKIGKGEGAIVEQNGEKLAVYRDKNNHVHAVSAVCTHMKCIVTFNSAEKTWDCPCHASRFRVDGSVIEGPALSPLEERKL